MGTLVLFELFLTLACRSEKNSIFRIGFFTNKLLIIANLTSIILMLAIMYIPFLQGPFHVVPLGLEDWAFMLPISLTGFFSLEIAKLVLRRRKRNIKG